MVSVIIPNYNHAAFLEKRINSVLNQTYRDFEVIILDDCSTDNSKHVINQFSDHPKVSHIIYNDTNSGSTFKQWKNGINLAKGEYIWIAESDDCCSLNFLEVAIEYNKKNQSDFFYCKSVTIDENDRHLDELEFWLDDLSLSKWKSSYQETADNALQFLIKKNYIVNASAVLFRNKKKEVQQYLKVVDNYRYCGDWLFWLQYLKETVNVGYSVKATNYFRTHINTTRSIPNISQKNTELAKIYVWIKENFKIKDENNLINYYILHHFKIFPRRFIFKNLSLAYSIWKYSSQLSIRLLQKKYTSNN